MFKLYEHTQIDQIEIKCVSVLLYIKSKNDSWGYLDSCLYRKMNYKVRLAASDFSPRLKIPVSLNVTSMNRILVNA